LEFTQKIAAGGEVPFKGGRTPEITVPGRSSGKGVPIDKKLTFEREKLQGLCTETRRTSKKKGKKSRNGLVVKERGKGGFVAEGGRGERGRKKLPRNQKKGFSFLSGKGGKKWSSLPERETIVLYRGKKGN